MLDRAKLVQEIEKVAGLLFVDRSASYDIARNAWQQLCQDATFVYKVAQVTDAPWPLPTWQGRADEIISIEPMQQPYMICSVDGSQIYPDRHQAQYGCFLINIGGVLLAYKQPQLKKAVQFFSTPHIFPTHDEPITTEGVNCLRHELELQYGYDWTITHTADNAPHMVVFDGSLIFWHLEAQHGLKERFLQSYFLQLLRAAEKQLMMCGYISGPKSKELVHLLRLYLCNFKPENSERYEAVNHLTDVAIVRMFLPQYHRTTIFKNNSNISSLYPASVHPYFFYLHVGAEIGRVEIPAWIAHQEKLVNTIAAIIIDQSLKGNGYPIVLAEAHEQAVVKMHDREFFYHYLQKISMHYNQRLSADSYKLQRKIRMGI